MQCSQLEKEIATIKENDLRANIKDLKSLLDECLGGNIICYYIIFYAHF